jgi:YbgC/YbaW family acyl-CoA thioester hydrolase
MDIIKKDQSDKSENTLFLISKPVYFRKIHVHETDKDGVVHFSNYYKIAEEALYSCLSKFGFSFVDAGYSMAMINSLASYFHPIKFADCINIKISEIIVQRVKLVFSLSFNDSSQTCLAKIRLTFVLIDPVVRKAIPVPENLKIKLNEFVLNQVATDL